MRTELLQPQEVEVFYILPAIRSRMAATLKKQGMKQKDIAVLLCVKESTVSQYLSSKRAAEFQLSEEADREIKDSVNRIKTRYDLVRETQKLLLGIKKEKTLCRIHQKLVRLPAECDACFV